MCCSRYCYEGDSACLATAQCDRSPTVQGLDYGSCVAHNVLGVRDYNYPYDFMSVMQYSKTR